MPFADADSRCPCCDGWLDRFGDHALACCGAGDRTRRHNLIRNLVYHAASAAGLSPELEKPGLLAQRPSSGSAYENGASCRTGDSDPSFRRPADVFIPRWRSGPPAAWDFAVTSGMLPGNLSLVVQGGCDEVLSKYEDFKCSFKDTRSLCEAQGFSFVPMILEATGGGWGKMARCVWSELAKNSALATGELSSEQSCAIELRQRISMTLHRENARACLRRFGW